MSLQGAFSKSFKVGAQSGSLTPLAEGVTEALGTHGHM